MVSPADTVLVTGNATFNSASSVNQLTQGYLRIGGNFTQLATTSPFSFPPSGAHVTALGSGVGRTASFASPGTGSAGAHFANLDVSSATGGITLSGIVNVDGKLSSLVGAGAAPTLKAPTSPCREAPRSAGRP
jgi:hypothetical protein